MEDVLFSSGTISVTRSVAKFGGTTYPIANIGSVTIEHEPRKLAILLTLIGILGGLWAIAEYGFWIGASLFALCIFGASRVPKKRKLTLKTSSGDVTALTSNDINLVENVRAAIERAFVR